MLKKITILLLPVLIIGLTGCATGKKKELERQGLKNQITVLEAQVQSKDQEISALKDSLNKPVDQREDVTFKSNINSKIKSRPKARHIQLALKNAGYYSGPVDGKIGKETKEAIRAFQKANNLTADGRMGKKTWEILRSHLYQKIK